MDISIQDLQAQKFSVQTEPDCDLPDDSEYKTVLLQQHHQED